MENTSAPELAVHRWFNTPEPLTLAGLRGKVVVLHAFQMLCPGCVSRGTPQAEKLHRLLGGSGELAVIGLHTVFEHHAAMTEISLEAFIQEYRLTLPIGVDRPRTDGPIPETMRRYGMRGTPTTLVIDRDGFIREHAFGQVEDLALGALVGSLLARRASAMPYSEINRDDACDASGCSIPRSAL
jgi:peroxiredoxin